MVVSVPDTIHTSLSLRVGRETYGDIQTQMFKEDEITKELLAMVTNQEVVQDNDKTKRSQLDKRVWDLSLDQPQASVGGV